MRRHTDKVTNHLIEGETQTRENCPPSEGDQKKRETNAPLEGGKGVWCWKMQLQAFS